MARQLTYAERTLHSRNPLTRYAHRSRYRISLAMANRLLPQGGRIVDFGAGDGTFLARLHEMRPDARLTAVEPRMHIGHDFIERLGALGDCAPGSAELVTAFETLEHVSDDEVTQFLDDAEAALAPEGRLLVTVPIMYGAALPLKELSKTLLYRRRGDTGALELLRGTFGLPIARTPTRLESHKGFDFRPLKRLIDAQLPLLETGYSPLAALPWWLNSQAIFVARKSAGAR